MAKIKFGMMMADARGKLGGQVFSKNRSGAYVRTKVTPVNPRTSFQQANRSLLGNLSAGWSRLTEGQRSAWNKSVVDWQRTNVFGDLAKPTGKNLFTGLNKNRLNLFPMLDIQLTPPAKAELAVISIRSVTYSVGTNAFIVNVERAGAGGLDVRVRATPAVSNGTNFVNNLLRQVGATFEVPVGGAVSIGTAYTERFGSVTTGSKIFVELAVVAPNGQIGVPVMAVVITVP